MLVAELFFGRNIKGRGALTEAEWVKFAADTITPNFPDGFAGVVVAVGYNGSMGGQPGAESASVGCYVSTMGVAAGRSCSADRRARFFPG
jgi:hypothetical protein